MNTNLPPQASLTSRENPWPLRLLNEKIKTYVDRMVPLWVEGQVVQLSRRPGSKMSFLTLRDAEADVSINVSLWGSALEGLGDSLTEGSRVVIRAKPTFWERRGSFQLQAAEIHLVGVGDLLVEIERLRRKLTAEGLFEKSRKLPLPFLPRRIGLICGSQAKAENDVIVNAQNRWPGADFEIRHVMVQGDRSVSTVCAALAELDALPEVQVIVITRGGGAVEDLLSFSDEKMVRAVAAAQTPIVSAIGHETDCPLLDLVADYRASTPTDAARRIVPDLADEARRLTEATSRMRNSLNTRVTNEITNINNLRSQLESPIRIIERHGDAVTQLRQMLTTAINHQIELATSDLSTQRAGLKALSPQAVLERGYAVLRLPDGSVVKESTQVAKGALVEGILAKGSLVAQVMGSNVNRIPPKK